MEYTIKKIAQLSGISTRTLRYYDEIDLLKPARINSSGYRIYGKKEVDRLQQILFYRSLELKLEQIKTILDQPDFSFQQALEEHQQALLDKRQQIDLLLATVEQTLRYHKGEQTMSDKEKFTAFKQQKLAENELTYGTEIVEKYGEETVQHANRKWLSLTSEKFELMQQAETQLIAALKQVSETSDLDSEAAKQIYEAHKTWLGFSWPTYSADAHKGLVDMYVADERFADYYDSKAGTAVTQLLHDAVYHYAK